jgi:hypothetical protein
VLVRHDRSWEEESLKDILYKTWPRRLGAGAKPCRHAKSYAARCAALRCQPTRRSSVVGQRLAAGRASLYNDNVQLYREGITMKKLLSLLIAAMFAAVSFQAVAQGEKKEEKTEMKVEKKVQKKAKAKKHAKAKKVAKKKVEKKEAAPKQ